MHSSIGLKVILDQLDKRICLVDHKGYIQFINKAWKDFALENEFSNSSLIGENYFDVSKKEASVDDHFNEELKKVLSGQREQIEVEYPSQLSKHKQWFRVRAVGIETEEEWYVLIIHENITLQNIRAVEIDLLFKATDIIYSADTLSKELYTQILQMLCNTSEWTLGEVWEPVEGKNSLRYYGACYCKKRDFSAFCKAAEDIKFEKGVGLPGKVFKTEAPHWIEDLSQSDNFLRADVANKLGFNSALGMPVKFEEKLYAIFCFYHVGSSAKDEHVIKMMSSVCKHLGLLFSKSGLKKDLKRQRDFLSTILNDQSEMVVRWKNRGEITFANNAFLKTFQSVYVNNDRTNYYELFDSSDEQDFWRGIEKLTPENSSITRTFKIKLPNGTSGYHEWMDRAFFDDEGTVVEYQSIGRDITQQHAQQRLIEIVLEAAGVGTFENIPTRQKSTFDSRFRKIFGVDADSNFQPEDFFSKLIPEDRQRVKDSYAENMKKKGPDHFNLEYRIMVNEKEKHILAFGRVFRFASGEVERIVGTVQDITTLRKSEADVKRKEKLFRSIVHDQNEMIVRWKKDGILTFVNKAYLQTFAKKEKEVIGSSFYELINKQDVIRVKNAISKLTVENPIRKDIHRVKLPDGSKGYQEWTDRAFFDSNNQITEYQSVGRDITSETLAKRDLIDSEHRLSIIFQNTSDMMALISCKNDNYYLEALNNAYLAMLQKFGLNLTRKELTGNTLKNVYAVIGLPDDVAREKIENVNKAEQTNQQLEFLEITQLKGKIMYGNTQLIPIIDGEQGEITHVLWTSRDITEAKEYELKLEQTVKELNKLKGKLEEENILLRESIAGVNHQGDLIYASKTFQEVVNSVYGIAPLDTSVLLTGETGTGKEVIATTIHKASKRSEMPFIRVNCGAIPKELIESELFGYEKGAFTGADKTKPGRFELANGGTLMLDEIGEMPLETQVKLLRVLQDGKIEPLGSVESKKIDVRIIAATNRDLPKEIERNRFREDLFYRLNVFPIHIPALRERREDIPVLIKFFIEKFTKKYNKSIASISSRAMGYFYNYDWPGNIRELENLMERCVILSQTERLFVPDLDGKESVKLKTGFQTLDEVQKQHVLMVLEASDWKIEGKDGAAVELGLSPSTLRDRMKKYNIKRT